MPTWTELQDELSQYTPERRGKFITELSRQSIERIAALYDRNVLFYASGFLQKPQSSLFTLLDTEDINGFMAGVHGHKADKGLLLVLHTSGGMAEAAQTIVEYLRSKYCDIDILVPTYAMSAGTMIALGCDRIIMGRQSQLGPTDPQLIFSNGAFSAHSIIAQFDEAKREIADNPVLAHAWAPVLRPFGPALLEEARKSLAYGQELVKEWLQKYMFAKCDDPSGLAREVAEHFGGHQHSHGRRIDREEARQQHLKIVDLEDCQELQEAVLTLYHLTTIVFEQTSAVKSLLSSNGRMWIKNMPSG